MEQTATTVSGTGKGDSLEERLREAKKRRDSIIRVRRMYVYSGFILLLCGVLSFIALYFGIGPHISDKGAIETLALSITGLGVVLCLGAALMLPASRERDIKEIQDEIDLRQMTEATPEQKAHKLLSIQQGQLSRYFDVILQQSRSIFVVGIFAMLVGVGVVVWAIWQTQIVKGDLGEKAIVAGLGAIGAILTNYIAAIFLKMFADIGQAVQRSVGAMTQSLQLNFANVVISNIEKPEVRDEARKALVVSFKGTPSS
jgi:hypothetical protein